MWTLDYSHTAFAFRPALPPAPGYIWQVQVDTAGSLRLSLPSFDVISILAILTPRRSEARVLESSQQ
jgi:hypothetical protein